MSLEPNKVLCKKRKETAIEEGKVLRAIGSDKPKTQGGCLVLFYKLAVRKMLG